MNIDYTPVPWISKGKTKERMKDRRMDKYQLIEAQIQSKRKKNPFIRQLKINYLATYATILNNKTTKTTKHDTQVKQNKPKVTKIIITTQDKYKYRLKA